MKICIKMPLILCILNNRHVYLFVNNKLLGKMYFWSLMFGIIVYLVPKVRKIVLNGSYVKNDS